MTAPSPGHSALGIAALAVSVCALVMFAITAHVAHAPAQAAMLTLPVLVVVLLAISAGLTLLGVALGLGGVLQHRRKRVTGVLALGLSLALVLAQVSLTSWMHQQWQHAHPPAGSSAAALPALTG